ncbi:hypothetical protein [Chamaesiphon sp.]|uniref:hypothetical protein n=1 Tax=Chamaesiphon sp. TaxID=2814140 RepID=UPI0035944E94
MITTQAFTTYFILYTFASLVLALGISFTGAAWIIYFFSLLPFYLICTLYCLSFYLNHRDRQLKFTASFWYLIPIFQVIFMATSPAECRLWHQGRACYSFMQSHLDNTQGDPAHWNFVEIVFPLSLLLYSLSLVAFLKKTQIQ